MMKRSIYFWSFAVALVAQSVSPGSLFAQANELPPGRIANPAGSQKSQGAAYNPVDDEYMIIFHGDDVRLQRLSPEGVELGPEISITGNIGSLNSVGIEYNPVTHDYLTGWRTGESIFIRFIHPDGQPKSGIFFVASGGSFDGGGGGALSVTSQRYMIVWRKGPAPVKVKYALIDADATNLNPVLKTGNLSTGDGPAIAWGSQNNEFMVAYVVSGGSAKEEVNGRRISIGANDSVSISSDFGVANGKKSQTKPEIAYASSNNTFLVTMEDRRNNAAQNANVTGQRLNSTGGKIGGRFDIIANVANVWDVPGPIDYNEATGKYMVTAFYGFTGAAVEVDPEDGSVGDRIILGTNVNVPVGIAMRDDSGEPQALVMTKKNLGGDGVHAHLVDLPTPPPTFTSPDMVDGFFGVFYSEMIPVAGGTPPLVYEFIVGQVAPELNFDQASGTVSGTPTTLGDFGPFTVKVTDNDGRVAQGDLMHHITLGIPVLLDPLSEAVTDETPTFDWEDVPGATAYHLIAENITSGGTPINKLNIPSSTFTPDANLPAGNLYQWKVQANGVGADGAFSDYETFEIDTQLPPPVVLMGTVPSGLTSLAGLVATEASSERNDKGWVKENLVDSDDDTFWRSVNQGSSTPEHVVVNLGVAVDVSRVRLRMPAGENPTLFPKGFEIQIGNEPNFTVVHVETDFVAQADMWYDFDISPPLNGECVKIQVTETNRYSGGTYSALLGEIEVLEDNAVLGTIEYSWLAPADDEGGGTEPVVTYDFRIQQKPAVNFDYNAATQVVNEPSPGTAGTMQTLSLTWLLDETTYSAAVTSIDDAGNRSVLSNIFTLATRGVPPGAITSLRAFNPTKTSIDIDWNAPNEDGTAGGSVQEYEVRVSESPINTANFSSATLVTDEVPPGPAGPGTLQDTTINGLNPTTHYYVAMISRDDAVPPNVSPISNVVEIQTDDGTPPEVIDDLQGISGGGVLTPIAPLTAIDSSGFRSDRTMDKAVDGDVATFWGSEGVKPMQNEFITIDFSSEKNVGRVRLHSDNQSVLLFPKTFQIQVGNDPNFNNFTIALTVTNFVANFFEWHTFDVTPTMGRYVRIFVTESNQYTNSKFYSDIAEIEVFELQPAADGVSLLFTAPGDDDDQGTADKYIIAYSPTEIIDDTDFNNAMKVDESDVPAPQEAGMPENITLTGFGPEEVLWIAIKTEDNNMNVSNMSNVIKVSTPGTPPGEVTGLQVLGAQATGHSITIEFVEPPDDAGDNGSGPVDHYLVACSTSAINTLADFQALTPADPGPAPVSVGNTITFEIPGLANQTDYNCGVVAVDDADLTSGLSAIVSGSTIDEEAPGQATNLSADIVIMPLPQTVIGSSGFRKSRVPESAVDGDVTSYWGSIARNTVTTEFITLDLGSEANVGRVRMHSNDQGALLFPKSFQIQVGNDPNFNVFTVALTVTDFVADFFSWHTFDVTPTMGRYVRIWVNDTNLYTNGKFYSDIAEIEVSEFGGPAIEGTLTWLAPADDGNAGALATSYEIRMDTSEITVGNFDGADLVVTGLVPQAPGSLETYVIDSGIQSGTTNWFAIKTSDEAGNFSITITSAVVP